MTDFSSGSNSIILIGTSVCDRDEENLPPLPQVKNNIEALKSIFLDINIIGIDETSIHCIIDSKDNTALYEQVADFAARTLDSILIYYSGHGIKSYSANGLYIATRNTTEKYCHLNGAEFLKIRKILRDSPARVKILIFDCCYSGEILGSEMGGGANSILADAIDNSGVYAMASAPANALAYAPRGAQFTAFSGALIATLRQGRPGDAEFLTVHDLFQEIYRKIVADPLMPPPQQKNENMAGSFKFARNVAMGVGQSPPRRQELLSNPPPHRSLMEKILIYLSEKDLLTERGFFGTSAAAALISIVSFCIEYFTQYITQGGSGGTGPISDRPELTSVSWTTPDKPWVAAQDVGSSQSFFSVPLAAISIGTEMVSNRDINMRVSAVAFDGPVSVLPAGSTVIVWEKRLLTDKSGSAAGMTQLWVRIGIKN